MEAEEDVLPIGERLQSLIGSDHFEISVTKPVQKKRHTPKPTIQVWLPLSFPTIPKKGQFDVRRLKHSDYFFS